MECNNIFDDKFLCIKLHRKSGLMFHYFHEKRCSYIFRSKIESGHLLINQFYLPSHEQQYYFTNVSNMLYSGALVQRSEATIGGVL